MRRWIVLGLAALPVGAHAGAPSPRHVADQFVAAWNTHDLKAFEALYTPDAVWVPVAEERTRGRADILAEFAKIHTGAGWAVRTTIAEKDVPEVHLLKPDVATVFFHMDFLAAGKPIAGLQRAMVLVAVRGPDGWRIAAGQLTKESASAG